MANPPDGMVDLRAIGREIGLAAREMYDAVGGDEGGVVIARKDDETGLKITDQLRMSDCINAAVQVYKHSTTKAWP